MNEKLNDGSDFGASRGLIGFAWKGELDTYHILILISINRKKYIYKYTESILKKKTEIE
jgi:hypothetical protein